MDESVAAPPNPGRGRGRGRGNGRGRRGGEQRASEPAQVNGENSEHVGEEEQQQRGGRGGGRGGRRGDGEGRGRGNHRAKELFPDDVAEIERLSQEIDLCYRNLEGLSQKETQLKQSLQEAKEKRNQTRDSLNHVFQSNSGNITSKKDKDAKISSLTKDIGQKTKTLKDIREKLPFKETDDPEFEKKVEQAYETKRKALEKQIETASSGPEERKFINQMNDLRREKNTLLPQYLQAKDQLQKDIALKKHLQSLAGQEQEKINHIKSEEAGIKAEVETLNGKVKEIFEEIQKIREKRGQESQKIESLRKERDAQHELIHEKFNEHHEMIKYERERREQARLERIEENERKRKEWEERKRQEELERIPFEVEVQTCETVANYLEAQLKLFKGAAGVEKKKQQRSNRQRMHVICNPPEMVQLFEYLSLVLPILQTDLDGSLAQVHAKKAMFLTLREKEIEQRKNAENEKGKEAEEGQAAEEEVNETVSAEGGENDDHAKDEEIAVALE